MNRRTFAAALGGGLLALPRGGRAQQPARVPRIGVIGEHSDADPFVEAFRQGLRDLGYSEGRNIIIEYRSTHGALDRVPGLVRELLRLPVDVIVVGGGIAAQHAKAETATVPIVFATVGDPAGIGLVSSLARPGGNVTGMSNLQSELGPKQLELLKTVVPRIARVAVLYNPGSPISARIVHGVRESAQAQAIEMEFLEVRRPDALAGALSVLASRRAIRMFIPV